MATVQHFLLWLKRDKSNRDCVKMAAPEGPEISAFDDQYGMKQLLTRKLTPSQGQGQRHEQKLHGMAEQEKVIEQFSIAPYRASMKLPPIPREEGRERWSGFSGSRRPCGADSPAHIYEEIPWSAVETDYEEMSDDHRKSKQNKSAFLNKHQDQPDFTQQAGMTATRSAVNHQNGVNSARTENLTSSNAGNIQTNVPNSHFSARPSRKNPRGVNCVEPGQQPCEPYMVVQLPNQSQHHVTTDSVTRGNQSLQVPNPAQVRSAQHQHQIIPPETNVQGMEPRHSGTSELCRNSRRGIVPGNSEHSESRMIPQRMEVTGQKCVDFDVGSVRSSHPPGAVRRGTNPVTSHDVRMEINGGGGRPRLESVPQEQNSGESKTVRSPPGNNMECHQGNTQHPEHMDDGLEKYAGNFVQCTKCNRPHGLFNGTQIKHFDEHGEICGGGGGDRLSVRARNHVGTGNGSTQQFVRDSSKFGSKVRTNPRISERNFKFTRNGSIDNKMGVNQSETQTSPGGQNKVQESDSADTCNEYDLQTGSDRSKSGSNQSQRSSIASDSAASNLFGSEGGGGNLKNFDLSQPIKRGDNNDSNNCSSSSKPSQTTKLNESDSSNDTFSEYDIRSSDSYTSAKGLVDEYDFYLSKIRQNLLLKEDTLRVIRESEGSEYETSDYQSSSMGGSIYTTSGMSDASVMTSHGHDVSNCSAFSGGVPKDVKLKGILKTHPKGSGVFQNRPKRSIVIKEDSSRGNITGNLGVQARKKPNRRRSTGSVKSSLECYTLPDFTSESPSPVIPDSVNNNISKASSKDSVLDSSISTDPGSTGSGNESDILDRLSCRATNYKPQTPPLVSLTGAGGSTVSTLGGGSESAFTKVAPNKLNATAKSGSTAGLGKGGQQQTRVQAQGRPQHNRLLTDLMKINHDRQLLFL